MPNGANPRFNLVALRGGIQAAQRARHYLHPRFQAAAKLRKLIRKPRDGRRGVPKNCSPSSLLHMRALHEHLHRYLTQIDVRRDGAGGLARHKSLLPYIVGQDQTEVAVQVASQLDDFERRCSCGNRRLRLFQGHARPAKSRADGEAQLMFEPRSNQLGPDEGGSARLGVTV